MNKVEILEVLYEMREDWQASFDGLISTECISGFCKWFYLNVIIGGYLVLEELEKDKIKNSFYGYWYDRFFDSGSKESFIPRIDHLTRTITRLENELNPDHNGTIQ